jgi:triphosphoribosyl-dephospho-CoA synthase
MIRQAFRAPASDAAPEAAAPDAADGSADAAFVARLGEAAVLALIDEAELTPKPALVDRRGCGVHPDMSLAALRRSAVALGSYFHEMAWASLDRQPSPALRERLGAIGRAAEEAMLAATGGANAHRGAIWAVGLMVAAVAMLRRADPVAVGAAATALARLPDRVAPTRSLSHGRQVAARYGVGGARAEAEAGFPHALRVCLPTLRSARARGVDEDHARLDALMAVVAVMDDTCLLHRGGFAALTAAKTGAAKVLAAGGCATVEGQAALACLDATLVALNASPGGAADMLAAALFIDALERWPCSAPPAGEA